MYQLIKSTSFGGISVEESLSLSFLQEKMRKDFQEITKMKSVSASELQTKQRLFMQELNATTG